MFKAISILYKKPGISSEEYYKYWKEKHAPLVVRLVPGLRKYTQNHVVSIPGVKYEADGFAEVWFDHLEAYKKFLDWRQSDEAKELLDDEDKFLDRSRIVRYAIEEHVIL
jgi:uncharacterized protein (TIGR02118 family)